MNEMLDVLSKDKDQPYMKFNDTSSAWQAILCLYSPHDHDLGVNEIHILVAEKSKVFPGIRGTVDTRDIRFIGQLNDFSVWNSVTSGDLKVSTVYLDWLIAVVALFDTRHKKHSRWCFLVILHLWSSITRPKTIAGLHRVNGCPHRSHWDYKLYPLLPFINNM